MSNKKPSFRFEIDNFSEKKDYVIKSNTFVSGECEWFLAVYPKGNRLADGHLSLYLFVANSTTLQPEWKGSVNFYFVMLNQSGKELYRSPTSGGQGLFCAKKPGWGYQKALPLSKFQEEGFLEKDKLIIEVYINGGEVEDVSNKKKKTVDINGFHVFASQVTKVEKIFREHPDIALDFKPKNQEVKTAYMNVLLRVIKTLNKPPKSLSETRLSKASSELSELMNVGFKLDWLKSKLEEVSLERKKPDVDASRAQQVEERVKNLELKLEEVSLERKKPDVDESRALEERVKHLELKLEEVSLERKKPDVDESRALEERVKHLELKLDEASFRRSVSDAANEYRAQEVEERVRNLELMDVEFELASLNIKLDEVSLERKKGDDQRGKNLALMELRLNMKLDDLERKQSYDASVFDSRIELMEKDVMGLGLKLDSLSTKLEEMSKERKKADGSLVRKHEESVKNIEIMVSQLKVELDKKKDKTSDDGFLLVD